MKQDYKHMLFAFGAGLLISACNNYDWDTNHQTRLFPFTITTGDFAVEMKTNYRDSAVAGNNYELTWSEAKTEDYSTVFYDVLFYTSDESKPVFTAKPENLQTKNRLSLNEKELNVLAEKAAIPQNATGQIHWKVRASNGINEIFSNEKRTITLSRPDGYAAYPEQMYVKVNNVQTVLRKNTRNETAFDGEYEAYIYLSGSRFYLVDAAAIPRFFYISNNGKLEEVFDNQAENAAQNLVTPDKIHHILLDFKTAVARISAVNSVALWYSGTGEVWGELTQENPEIPVWSLTRQIELVNYPTAAPDYRYKFKITETNSDNQESVRFIGPRFPTVPNITPATSANYFQLYPADDSRSNYCYKFSIDHKNQKLKIDVDLQSDTNFFRHYITVIE